MKCIVVGMVLLLLWPACLEAEPLDSPAYEKARRAMVTHQLRNRGIKDTMVLDAMVRVLRHQFVPPKLAPHAYADQPLPIGEGQTISQPLIVALMTEALDIQGHERVLEVGTGSGYQAAVLARIVKEVYTIEIKPKLHRKSTQTLEALAYRNVFTRLGDGYFGWSEKAPFDCIMITAAVDHVPPPLLKQLKNGGRLVLPKGNPFSYQHLVRVTKSDGTYTIRHITDAMFVPMTGHALDKPRGGSPKKP